MLLFLHLLQPKSTGQDVFNRVEELLGIKELHFFSLTVVKGKVHCPLTRKCLSTKTNWSLC